MKKICKEGGRLVVYVDVSDMIALVNIKAIPVILFYEEIVKKIHGNEIKIYRISELNSANYVETAPFIPDKDYFKKLSIFEIEDICNRAIMERENLLKILRKLHCKEHLTNEEKQVFEGSIALDLSLVKEIQEVAFIADDTYRETRFTVLSNALTLQSSYYIKTVSDYLQSRKLKEKPKTRLRRLLKKKFISL